MKDGYTWSGGPWFAKWNKGDSIVLTPNPKYWGPKPHLDKVVFKFETDTAAEFQAFKSGQVDAIYPQPQLDVVDAIKAGLPDAHTQYNAKTGIGRGALVQQRRTLPVRLEGGAPGDRLRDRPRRDREASCSARSA